MCVSEGDYTPYRTVFLEVCRRGIMVIIMKQLFDNVTTFLRTRTTYEWVLVGLLLGVYVSLSLWNLTKGAIWFDEAFSAYIIQFNAYDIARYTAADVHPPLYYWVLKVWSTIFGYTEVGLRSLSIVFGVVAAGFGYAWMRRQFGKQVAIISLAILVLSPLFIRYSQEARMYTMSAAIAMAATYVMTIALDSKRRRDWIIYGVLVAAGMLTHYFMALVWIAHWVWRVVVIRQKGATGKVLFKRFFDKDWLIAYGLAIGLFLPWLPFMVYQLVVIQSGGFWISPVGVDSVGSYFGTLVYFLQSNQVVGWQSAGLILMAIVVGVSAVVTYRRLRVAERRSYWLLLCLAAVPPLVLYAASLPPLQSSFVERYLLPAAVASALFVGLVLVVGLRRSSIWAKLTVAAIVLAMLMSGLSTMYFYGNYNKNSQTDIQTRNVVMMVRERSEPGTPIITNTPWVFYEAAFYNSEDYPIYFLDKSTKYEFGSLLMLQEDDRFKIKDLDKFLLEHPTVWYIGHASAELEAPRDSLETIDRVEAVSPVDGKSLYKGIKLQTASAE
ncbi:hypothetical protein B7Y94_01205 [Candidatus Saccharibacteria bacterium 32-49-12]|nr:MAG: hypothetical protein B7Y94_01205 [Candidatus Saccharibacteria bacterium 32-49-12]